MRLLINKKFSLFVVIALVSSFAVAGKIRAINIDTTIENLHTKIQNDIDTKANSGHNESNGGSITTGDAGSETVVTNVVNTNVVNCCTTPTPTPLPTPTKGPDPTATPTPTPGTPGGGGGGGGGGTGGTSVSNPAPQGQVLGLSATAGPGYDRLIFYLIGSLCLGTGGRFLTGKKFILA